MKALDLPPLKKGELSARFASLSEKFELGQWQAMLSYDDITYARIDGEDTPDYFYHWVLERDRATVGYMIGTVINAAENSEAFSLYERVLELTDVAIALTERKEEGFALLMDYATALARAEGASVIACKARDGYGEFTKLLLSLCKAKLAGGYLKIQLEGFTLPTERAHLKRAEGDGIELNTLYHLYSLGFKVFENHCAYRLKSGAEILVDRHDGVIYYPHALASSSLEQNVNKQKCKDALAYLIRCESDGRIKDSVRLDLSVKDSKGNRACLDAINLGKAVIFDDESYITKHPSELALIMKIPGIEAVVFYKTELNLAEEKIIQITKEYSKQKLAGFDPRR